MLESRPVPDPCPIHFDLIHMNPSKGTDSNNSRDLSHFPRRKPDSWAFEMVGSRPKALQRTVLGRGIHTDWIRRMGSTSYICDLGRDMIKMDPYYRKIRGKFSIALKKLFASSGMGWALEVLDFLQGISILLSFLQAGDSSLLFDALTIEIDDPIFRWSHLCCFGFLTKTSISERLRRQIILRWVSRAGMCPADVPLK